MVVALASLVTRAGEPLPGTARLDGDIDFATEMVAGVDRFLLDQTAQSIAARVRRWHRETDTPFLEEYQESVLPNRLRLAEIVGGLKGFVVNLGGKKLELVGRTLWKGKVFYRDQRVLRNRIEDLAILGPLIDGKTTDLQKISVKGRDAWLLFPARLYCGQSLIDSRRESIVIDYAFSDAIAGYRERPDFLAGRRGLKVRDEIRMVRPGFYLGRAYVDRTFLLNFTLVNADVAERDGKAFLDTGKVAEDCWPGTQRTTVAGR